MQDALGIDDDRTIRPARLLPLEQEAQRNAVKPLRGLRLDAGQVQQCRREIDVRSQFVDRTGARHVAGGPVEEQRYTVTPVVLAALDSPHACVEETSAVPGTVVGHEHQDRILLKARLSQVPP